MGVVHQPIEDGVGQGGVLHGSMPCFYRQLTGDDGGLAVIAFFDISRSSRCSSLVRGEMRRSSKINTSHLLIGAKSLA